MALKKVKLGDLINVVDERNNIGSRDFYGININKEFMPTVADIVCCRKGLIFCGMT